MNLIKSFSLSVSFLLNWVWFDCGFWPSKQRPLLFNLFFCTNKYFETRHYLGPKLIASCFLRKTFQSEISVLLIPLFEKLLNILDKTLKGFSIGFEKMLQGIRAILVVFLVQLNSKYGESVLFPIEEKYPLTVILFRIHQWSQCR